MITTTINKNIQEEEKKENIRLSFSQIPWNATPNCKHGLFSMRSNVDSIAGDNVYGKGKSRAISGLGSVVSYLERSAQMDVFKCVEGGTIITTHPNEDEFIEKLQELGTRALKYYSSLPFEQVEVTDNWAKAARVRDGAALKYSVPLHRRVLNRGRKRFTSKAVTAKEQVIDMIKNSRGMLAEGPVVAFLNSGLKCPECKAVGQIGWCDAVSHRSVDAFRDAVCMNCHKKGVITLFEIKTRWEKMVLKDGNGTYAGSFVALNTLMTLEANIYLVVVSRDTGNVRIGKITSAKMRGNHNWLYALQEGLKWGGPSSYVTCAAGFMMCPVKMTPLVDTLPDSLVEKISTAALAGIEGL